MVLAWFGEGFREVPGFKKPAFWNIITGRVQKRFWCHFRGPGKDFRIFQCLFGACFGSKHFFERCSLKGFWLASGMNFGSILEGLGSWCHFGGEDFGDIWKSFGVKSKMIEKIYA